MSTTTIARTLLAATLITSAAAPVLVRLAPSSEDRRAPVVAPPPRAASSAAATEVGLAPERRRAAREHLAPTRTDLTAADAENLAAGSVLFHAKVSHTRGGPFRPALGNKDQFGRAVAALGDVDGDGFVDLAVGAQKDDDGGSSGVESNLGAVWILFLDANGEPRESKKISATQGGFTGHLDQGDEFGRGVGALGDLDGDGTPDLIVGASDDDDGGPNRGAAWILLLEPDGSVKGHTKISDTQGGFTADLDDGDEFGRAFARLGDLDGNGVGDVAVSAALDGDGGAEAGAFYVLFLEADGTVASHRKVSHLEGDLGGPLKHHDWFAIGLAALGDVDGDGVVDLAAGACGDDTGGFQKGAAWVLFMNTDGTVRTSTKLTTESLGGALDRKDQFGYGCAGPGDVDGDGIPDLVVGAALDDDGGGGGSNSNRGALYVIFLRADGTARAHEKISATRGGFSDGLGVQDWLGCSVTSLGDLNGDGWSDLSVGVRFDDDGGANRGAVFQLFLQGVAN